VRPAAFARPAINAIESRGLGDREDVVDRDAEARELARGVFAQPATAARGVRYAEAAIGSRTESTRC
jgi:hypothetical protein